MWNISYLDDSTGEAGAVALLLFERRTGYGYCDVKARRMNRDYLFVCFHSGHCSFVWSVLLHVPHVYRFCLLCGLVLGLSCVDGSAFFAGLLFCFVVNDCVLFFFANICLSICCMFLIFRRAVTASMSFHLPSSSYDDVYVFHLVRGS